MRHSYDAVIAQLTDANKKLSSAKAASDKDDEIIRQLRKENALLRIIAERKASATIDPAESEESTNGPSIPELRGWRPRQRPPTGQGAIPTGRAQAAAQPAAPSAMEESGRGKLVATLTSPKKTEAAATDTGKDRCHAGEDTDKRACQAGDDREEGTPPPPSPAPTKETGKGARRQHRSRRPVKPPR